MNGEPHRYVRALGQLRAAKRVGFVEAVAPGHVESRGPLSCVGDTCEIESADGPLLAEVAAIGRDRVVLVPLEQARAIAPNARVLARPIQAKAPVGEEFAGRAVDAMGTPIDHGPPILAHTWAPLQGRVLAPLERTAPVRAIETGVRAIDALLTLGRGQRVGLFAAAGVGKTTLMSELAFGVDCDRCVLCLVGERGREVESIWRTVAARTDKARYACVAATSDKSAPLRARAVHQALALAEYWRDRGEHVLLIVDSATRFAMALREIGLAAGAPPTLRAYTPNVFAALPRIVERCGAAAAGGAITAVMTVLSETDDVDDPITELMKSLLDGHIVLSRQLAEQSHYPAIDVLRSVSRHSHALMSHEHGAAAGRLLHLLSAYEEARVLVESGIHKPGASARIDEAVAARDAIMRFLRQRGGERSPLADTIAQLVQASAGGRHA
ncbi:MAG TPA: FliI/YscN family ATPase [Vitreimonas sp.]|uniref:FliI/YscN family ATPase n=1 Tax=Vitreimonas sp. TaxID=3069702 RepID=UPI002D664823|nr:FliI/YscN family ATPase [Vitreimonas sp.]HYD85990.1 FliI/YscN family ATPase [Vitreimonas sp.]